MMLCRNRNWKLAELLLLGSECSLTLAMVTPIQKSWQIPVFLKPLFKPGIKKLGLDMGSGYTTNSRLP
jgi:hypothetical protein